MYSVARLFAATGLAALLGFAAAAAAEPAADDSAGALELEQQIQKLRASNHRVMPLPVQSVRHPQNPLPHDAASPTLEIILTTLDPQSQSWYRRRELRCFDSQARIISSTWLSSSRFRVKSHRPLPPGRSQYICTLPTRNGWLYWYSHTWIRAEDPS
jgi:hypothetical protein